MERVGSPAHLQSVKLTSAHSRNGEAVDYVKLDSVIPLRDFPVYDDASTSAGLFTVWPSFGLTCTYRIVVSMSL